MRAEPEALPKIRLFVSAALAAGIGVELNPGQAHYVLRVMRLAPRQRIRLFNGRDGEWLGSLAPGGRAKVTVEIEKMIRAQDVEDGPWLAFAPVKKSPTDVIVEKATELGVSRILPVLTERTVAHRVNIERLHAIAVEAAEQSGRLSVPEIAAPVALPLLTATWPAPRALFVAHPCAQRAPLPLLDALAGHRHSGNWSASASGPPPGFLIGPEGGLTSAELDGLAGLPCAMVVRLGPRTLRAETAAVAVLAVWQALREAPGKGSATPQLKNNSGQL